MNSETNKAGTYTKRERELGVTFVFGEVLIEKAKFHGSADGERGRKSY